MSKIGIHIAAWPYTFDKKLLNYFHKVKTLGFDGIELVLPIPDEININFIEFLKDELEALGLECTGSVALRKNENLVDKNPVIRDRGKAYLKKWINISAVLGCSILAGPICGAFELYKGRGRTDEEWDFAVCGLREIADHAESRNINLEIEVLNRYESYFINTAEDAVRLVTEIDRQNVKILLDTYHMNIGEKNIPAAIKDCGDLLGHFHISCNDRGAPGTGHIN